MDTAAATPVDRRVAKVMRRIERKFFGNPSSLHAEGVAAAAAVAEARAKIAALIEAHPDEIIFTSGGTESNNLAINGLGAPLVTSTIEHSSVREPALALQQRGESVFLVPVGSDGVVNLKLFKDALAPGTKLVSIMYANNEIGTIQPIREIAKIIRAHRKAHNVRTPYFHIDACQATRFLDLSVARLGVDLMTFNAAKMYGPKGVGVLYLRRGVELGPQLVGGGQENNHRAGTENVTGIVGLAEALQLAAEAKTREAARLAELRDYFINGALTVEGVSLNGSAQQRLPNNVNLAIAGVDAEQAVIELDARGVAASTGSACSIINRDESYVILALGVDQAQARSSIRFSFGRETTRRDCQRALSQLQAVITKLRSTK